MKKNLKPFIFTALACTFLFGACMSTQAASKVAINDENFALAIKEYAEEADTNKDGYLSKKEAARVKEIFPTSSETGNVWKGIQYFTNLKTLYYMSDQNEKYEQTWKENKGTSTQIMDLTEMKKLEKVVIYCNNPILQGINLEGCKTLKNLYIEGYGNIDSLNVKGCTNLNSIYAWNISAAKINVSGLKKLKMVQFNGNIKKLNLKKCTALDSLYVDCDSLETLKLKGANNLEYLTVFSDSLPSLDLHTNVGLKQASVALPAMETLDLSHNEKLKKIDVGGSQKLKTLDVTGCPRLKTLDCSNTSLSKLNIKKNPALRTLICENTMIKSLNLKKNKNLKELNCLGTDIQELNLSRTKIRKPSALQCDENVSVIYR